MKQVSFDNWICCNCVVNELATKDLLYSELLCTYTLVCTGIGVCCNGVVN